MKHSPLVAFQRLSDSVMFRWRETENRLHPSSLRVHEVHDWRQLPGVLGVQSTPSLAGACESELTSLESDLHRAMEQRPRLPFPVEYQLDESTRHALYFLTRCIRPHEVLETGVANGVSSWFLLAALEHNQQGNLQSIDYPMLDAERRSKIGCLVPTQLRTRWTLVLDDSRRGMETLLGDGHRIDMFFHDSEHSYLKMSAEYQLAWESLRPGGVLVSDDIDLNSAFGDLLRTLPEGVVSARCGRIGIVRKPNT